MPGRHLAHFNHARLRWPVDDPRVAEFLKGRDSIRRIAHAAPGFLWKLEVGAGEGTVAGDPRLLLSLSVWESPAALWHFAQRTLHRRFLRDRAKWFEPPSGPAFVMWWVAPGHRPDHEEAWDRLAHLARSGDSDHAFGWSWIPDHGAGLAAE